MNYIESILDPESPHPQMKCWLHAETDKAFAEVIQTSDLNSCAVAPWLLSTKWPGHLHVDGYDPGELMALVKPLTKWENSRLVDLVHQYFEDATNLIDYTDELTLQHLNTPDPTKYTST
jgi:hypothetical protein